MTTYDRFVRDGFLAALGGGPRTARTPPPSTTIGELWGHPLSDDLARLLDHLGEQSADAEPRLGEFMAFAATDWLPPVDQPLGFMMAEWFRRAALLTATVPLGTTGSGDIWLVEAAPVDRAARVFLLDHECDELYPIADSIAAFAWLCHLQNRDDVTRQEWDVLDGHVMGHNDVVVPAMRPFLAEDMRERFAASKDLRATLWFGGVERLKSDDGRADPHPAALIARMLRAFLRCEDTELSSQSASAERHTALLVRETARSLSERIGLDPSKRLQSLGAEGS